MYRTDRSLDPLGLERVLDHAAADDAYVVHLRTVPRRHDARDAVVLEIQAGIVIARVARLHATARDQRVIERPPAGLAVVMRTVAAGEKAETLDNRQLFGPRIGGALLEPAQRAGARAAEHDAALPCLTQDGVEALRAPDRLLIERVAARRD